MKHAWVMFYVLLGVTRLDFQCGNQDENRKENHEKNKDKISTCIQLLRMLTSSVPQSKFAIQEEKKLLVLISRDTKDQFPFLHDRFQECKSFLDIDSKSLKSLKSSKEFDSQIQYFKTHYLNYKAGYDMQGRKLILEYIDW